jgi:hypothetical protein
VICQSACQTSQIVLKAILLKSRDESNGASGPEIQDPSSSSRDPEHVENQIKCVVLYCTVFYCSTLCSALLCPALPFSSRYPRDNTGVPGGGFLVRKRKLTIIAVTFAGNPHPKKGRGGGGGVQVLYNVQYGIVSRDFLVTLMFTFSGLWDLQSGVVWCGGKGWIRVLDSHFPAGGG